MRQIDGKYKTDSDITKLDGTPIPGDEPIILFRAQDKLTPQMLEVYKKLCLDAGCQPGQIESLDPMIEKFKKWQVANSDKVKLPD